MPLSFGYASQTTPSDKIFPEQSCEFGPGAARGLPFFFLFLHILPLFQGFRERLCLGRSGPNPNICELKRVSDPTRDPLGALKCDAQRTLRPTLRTPSNWDKRFAGWSPVKTSFCEPGFHDPTCCIEWLRQAMARPPSINEQLRTRRQGSPSTALFTTRTNFCDGKRNGCAANIPTRDRLDSCVSIASKSPSSLRNGHPANCRAPSRLQLCPAGTGYPEASRTLHTLEPSEAAVGPEMPGQQRGQEHTARTVGNYPRTGAARNKCFPAAFGGGPTPTIFPRASDQQSPPGGRASRSPFFLPTAGQHQRGEWWLRSKQRDAPAVPRAFLKSLRSAFRLREPHNVPRSTAEMGIAPGPARHRKRGFVEDW